MSEYISPWIRCPECGKIFVGEITYEEDDYTNYCPHCGYKIPESEFTIPQGPYPIS